MGKTIVALYRDFSKAQLVIDELVGKGVGREQISVVYKNPLGREMDVSKEPGGSATRGGDYRPEAHPGDEELDAGSGGMIGSSMGAVLGGAAGAILAGVAGLTIPGVGMLLGVGPFAATVISGAGIGALTGGIAGALVNQGVTEEHANFYQWGVERGGTLVTVHADDGQVGTVAETLKRYDPSTPEQMDHFMSSQEDNSRKLSDAGMPEMSGDQGRFNSSVHVTGDGAAQPGQDMRDRVAAAIGEKREAVSASPAEMGSRVDMTSAGTPEVGSPSLGAVRTGAEKQNDPDALTGSRPGTPSQTPDAGEGRRAMNPDLQQMEGNRAAEREVLGSEGNTR